MTGAKRVFTTKEAEELLPAVDILLQKLVDTSVKQKLLEEQANEILDEVMEEGTHPNAIDELKGIKETLDINVREIDKIEGEIMNMGLNVKDSILGVVDFPAIRGDEPVYLCHRLGEHRVTHWHNVEDGFEGRSIIKKQVIYFLGETEEKDITLSHEHTDFIWANSDIALNTATYQKSKSVLNKALLTRKDMLNV